MATSITDLVQIPPQEIIIPSTASVIEVLESRMDNGDYKGATVISAKRLNDKQKELIAGIVTHAFDEKLRENYFSDLYGTDAVVFIENENNGVAIVRGHLLDIAAVDPAKQGNGVGSGLMYSALQLQEKLYWRSQTKRKLANDFYQSLMNNPQKFSGIDERKYFGYAVGLTQEEFKIALAYMQQKPKNFE